MEERRTESEGFEGCWTVVRCSGGQYVGRATRCLNPSTYEWEEVALDGHNLLHASMVKLEPSYEFVAQAQITQTPQGPAVTGKLFFATSVGANVKDCCVCLNLTGAMILPFTQMSKDDVETYKGIVNIARGQMAEAYKQLVGQRSNILITGDMPKHREGGGFRA